MINKSLYPILSTLLVTGTVYLSMRSMTQEPQTANNTLSTDDDGVFAFPSFWFNDDDDKGPTVETNQMFASKFETLNETLRSFLIELIGANAGRMEADLNDTLHRALSEVANEQIVRIDSKVESASLYLNTSLMGHIADISLETKEACIETVKSWNATLAKTIDKVVNARFENCTVKINAKEIVEQFMRIASEDNEMRVVIANALNSTLYDYARG